MEFSIRMEKIQELKPKNYTVSKDITWKVANGLMAVLFYIAAVLQVQDFLVLSMILGTSLPEN